MLNCNNGFKKAKKIWINNPKPNEFIEVNKQLVKGANSLLIACESEYAIFLDNALLYTGQYYSSKGLLAYDTFNFEVENESNLKIIAVYFGEGCSNYMPSEPAFIYEIKKDDEVIAFSDENQNVERVKGIKRANYLMTPQLGKGFTYELGICGEKVATVLSKNTSELIERPIEKCSYTKKNAKIINYGTYVLDGGETPAELMQNALLKTLYYDKTKEFNATLTENNWVLFDLGIETTGQIFFNIESQQEQTIIIGYGEHLDDLRLRSAVGGRNFAFSYKIKGGSTNFIQPFGRFGGRYLMCFFEKQAKINQLGIYEYLYPVDILKFESNDFITQKIYDVSVRTSQLCMHTHYEDCPWREQSFYGMDARNQMLYGYYMFGEKTFAKSALELFCSTQHEDGLFELCAPSAVSITIPSFSLFVLMAIAEYYDFSKDKDFVVRHKEMIDKCLNAFLSRLDDGLVPRLREKQYWNFYEWSKDLDGGIIFREEDQEPIIDLPLNAILVMTLRIISKLYNSFGFENNYYVLSNNIVENLDKKMYSDKEDCFASFLYQDKIWAYNELSQVLMLQIGSKKAKHLEKIILERRFPSVTIGFLAIKYDALIEYNCNNANYVFNDIERIYGKMLFNGATTFYETEIGADDFDCAGSLCHAWASIPAYIYRKYSLDLDYHNGKISVNKKVCERLKINKLEYVLDNKKNVLKN